MARQLSLLGGFQLRCAGREVAVARSGQRLLALQGRPLKRLWVAGTLWLDATEERAGASLRSALWRLPQPGGATVVEASTTQLRLARDLAVDVHELSARVEGLESLANHPDPDLDPSALARDLLPDWYEDWLVLERERFRQLRLHALEALSARLTAAGQFGAAVQAGLAAVAGEPLRESAHRTLIRAHLAEATRERRSASTTCTAACSPASWPWSRRRPSGGWSNRCCGDAAVTATGHRRGPCDPPQTTPRPSGPASWSSGSGWSRTHRASSGRA